jgi:hypothetical protein
MERKGISMEKRFTCAILLGVAVVILLLTACGPEPIPTPEETMAWESHFGFMPAAFDFQAAQELGVHWDRPFFEVFAWDVIEPQPGQFHWTETDRYVLEAQEHELHILITINPFARWDQMLCHQDLPPVEGFWAPRGVPCDREAYADFVQALVERYDGDGQDDMPDLKYPIRYWEVGNEPSVQLGPLVFFQGSPQDYLVLLEETYRAVKEADPQAQVVQGGMANVEDPSIDFWEPVLAAGGGDYFDIANVHSIDRGEHLYLPSFRHLLTRHGVEKPIWVTEAEYGWMTVPQPTPEEMANALGRSFVYALANGADKLFYVQLRTPPGGKPGEEPGFAKSASLLADEGQPQPIYFAYRTVLQKLDRFETVEKLEERVEGPRIEVGQYRFVVGGRPVYVLWGQGEQLEMGRSARVTDLLGHEETVELASITLTDSPLFIEPEE